MGRLLNINGNLISSRNGALLNQIPLKSDALFWLDGVIIEDGGQKYFRDKTGNGRKFLITGYDFDTTWVAGMPYKSAATISAPAADATLIAADINNYLYDSGGNPTQIPVVSLFQDIDYEHKLFCRHIAQVIDGNGVETSEPRVVDIALYNTVKSGVDLILCQNYFSVPSENGSAIWVDFDNGNDTTGNGTKAAPYATIGKVNGLTLANDAVVYLKSGTTSISAYLRFTKRLDFRGIGLVNFDCTSTAFLSLETEYARLSGLIVNVTGSAADSISVTRQYTVIDKCYLKNVNNNSITLNRCDITISNSILQKQFLVNSSTYAMNYNVDTCYLNSGTTYSVFISTGTTGISNVKNSKISKNIEIRKGATYNIIGNYIKSVISTSDSAVVGTHNFKYNYFKGYTTYAVRLSQNVKDSTITWNIENNTFIPTAEGTIAILLESQSNINIKRNLFNNSATEYNASQFILLRSSVARSGVLIENNRILAKSKGSVVQIGDESGSFNNGLTNVEIRNNSLYGNLYHGVVNSMHGIIIFFNKDVLIHHNYVNGANMAIGYKDNQYVHTGSIAYYNTIINCETSLLSKGCDGVKFYNNTCIRNSDYLNGGVNNKAMMYVIANGTYPPLNTVFRNNLFIDTGTANALFSIALIDDPAEVDSNNNTFYSAFNKVDVTTIRDTWAEWQAAGLDADSVFENIVFTGNYPTTPQSGAANLGTDYDDGIDVTTTFESNPPVIVTKQQGVTWQKGAYLQ